VAHEANLTGGFGAEVVTRLHEMFDGEISLKIKRVATPNVRMPAAPVLAQEVLPNASKIVEATRLVMAKSATGATTRER
jgi:2-oxoisovalerate dehydrogenase E1 component